MNSIGKAFQTENSLFRDFVAGKKVTYSKKGKKAPETKQEGK